LLGVKIAGIVNLPFVVREETRVIFRMQSSYYRLLGRWLVGWLAGWLAD
jgi:hypothetical protein